MNLRFGMRGDPPWSSSSSPKRSAQVVQVVSSSPEVVLLSSSSSSANDSPTRKSLRIQEKNSDEKKQVGSSSSASSASSFIKRGHRQVTPSPSTKKAKVTSDIGNESFYDTLDSLMLSIKNSIQAQSDYREQEKRKQEAIEEEKAGAKRQREEEKRQEAEKRREQAEERRQQTAVFTELLRFMQNSRERSWRLYFFITSLFQNFSVGSSSRSWIASSSLASWTHLNSL